jgi:ubiquinone/menaquinone biosynthesis C-methylase UbiE
MLLQAVDREETSFLEVVVTKAETRTMTNTLSHDEIHKFWWKTYFTEENLRFYGKVYDSIAKFCPPAANTTLLDAGCGNAVHAINLAERGYNILGIDFNEAVLKDADADVHKLGLENRIQFQQGNLLGLTFPDEKFDYVFCWGVLMHIPDIDMALSELSRVLKPGGMLILGENNMHSIQSMARRTMYSLKKNPNMRIQPTPAGLEYWKETAQGSLMARETNMQWLINKLESCGLKLERRVASHLTEAYAKTSNGFLQKLIYSLNAIWFDRVKLASPAFGNILFFTKQPVRPAQNLHTQ